MPRCYIVSTDLPFSQEIILKVQQFYESHDVSTVMLGQNDTKSVKVEGQGIWRVKLLKTSLRFPIINLFPTFVGCGCEYACGNGPGDTTARGVPRTYGKAAERGKALFSLEE